MKKKRKPYKKKTELQKLKNRVEDLCKQIIRIRDKNICQKCDRYVNHGDVSHVIPKSRSSYLRYDLINLKLFCRRCHLYWWHKDILAAFEWFKNKFPKRYEYLKQHEHDYKKWTVDELTKREKTLLSVLEQYEKGL